MGAKGRRVRGRGISLSRKEMAASPYMEGNVLKSLVGTWESLLIFLPDFRLRGYVPLSCLW